MPAKQYRAEKKFWPTNASPNQSPRSPQNFIDIAKVAPHLKSPLRRNIIHVPAASLSHANRQEQQATVMPGATQETTPVQILDPTSETNEEIDPAVDRDRIRVVGEAFGTKCANLSLTLPVAFWLNRNSGIFSV